MHFVEWTGGKSLLGQVINWFILAYNDVKNIVKIVAIYNIVGSDFINIWKSENILCPSDVSKRISGKKMFHLAYFGEVSS